MKIKDIIKQLKQYENQDCELVYDMFDEEDIREKAKDMEITVTDEEVKKVINYLERYADATEGMSWDTIEHAINEVIEE